MAVRRGRYMRIVPLVTQSGVDPERVVTAPLATGQYAFTAWLGHDELVIVDDRSGLQAATVAAHVYEQHRPIWIDDSPAVEVCEVATCEQARCWARETVQAVS